MAKPTTESKLKKLDNEIKACEKKIELEKAKLEKKKKEKSELEAKAMLEVVSQFNMSAKELKEFLSKHRSNQGMNHFNQPSQNQ